MSSLSRILLSAIFTIGASHLFAESNNPGIGIDGEIVVTPIVCPGTMTTATAKLNWPASVTNRPSGTFTWKIVPNDLAILTSPNGGTSTGNDKSEATLIVVSGYSTSTRSFQVQVQWKGPPNYNMPGKSATVAIRRDESSTRGQGVVLDWSGGPYELDDLVELSGVYAVIYKIFLKGCLQATGRVTSGYTETIQAHCPMDPNLTQEEIEHLRLLSRISAREVLDNNMDRIIIAAIRGALAVATGGNNPLSDPGAALGAFVDLAKRINEAANKAVTNQTTAGVYGPLKDPPGLADVKKEYDDVKEYARTAFVATKVDLVQWKLDDPKVALDFQGNKAKYEQDFIAWVVEKLTSGVPEPYRTILLAYMKNRFPKIPLP